MLRDQILSKRCGFLQGKKAVAVEEFISRISSTLIERERIKADLIIARSDTAQQFSLDEAIAGCKAAVESGANIAFVDAIKTPQEAERVVEAILPTPCLMNVGAQGPRVIFVQIYGLESQFNLLQLLEQLKVQ